MTSREGGAARGSSKDRPAPPRRCGRRYRIRRGGSRRPRSPGLLGADRRRAGASHRTRKSHPWFFTRPTTMGPILLEETLTDFEAIRWTPWPSSRDVTWPEFLRLEKRDSLPRARVVHGLVSGV